MSLTDTALPRLKFYICLRNSAFGARPMSELIPVGSGFHNKTKTHCPQGHPLSGDNLYVSRGRRECRTCRRIMGLRVPTCRSSQFP
jgi:hypothetical protein